jgi:hypothetical protein
MLNFIDISKLKRRVEGVAVRKNLSTNREIFSECRG